MKGLSVNQTCWALALAVALPVVAGAQRVTVTVEPFASNVIIPQRRVFHAPIHHPSSVAVRPPADTLNQVEITSVNAGVVIVEQVATTTMDIALRNRSGRQQQAELLVPVPDGAVVRGFTFQGGAKEPSARILTKEEARKTYDSIVAKMKDPALLEFVGYNLIRSSVFPVPANGTQMVRLTYENILPADGNRVDYALPRSEALDYSVPWTVSVKIKSKTPISTVYSPSHKIETTRKGAKDVSARIAADATHEPGAFRLSYLLEGDGVTASLLAYPDPKINGGYFLLLAGLPAKPPLREDGPGIKREVTLVLDRSGSMNGEKLDQVKEAALQIIAGLEEKETFNIIVYNEAVDLFAPKPVLKSEDSVKKARAFIQSITARGGTNIHDSLLEALRQKPTKDYLPIVLFLTDGLPTIGQTSEVTIRDVAIKANTYKRRIFTFGVGVDVNTPLLERIANETRATATFVLPREDVEVKVATVYKRLSGPILAAPELAVVNGKGEAAVGRTHDILPNRLADLFSGDQLVLLGQYVGEEPLKFELAGNYLGKQRKFKFNFELDKATTRNAFIPRLWASRKIGVLIDAIRQAGANGDPFKTKQISANDPKIKELVDEIVRLSTEFGILTEYTAFLAREGTDLTRQDEILAQAGRNFGGRAIGARSGLGSFNQEDNLQFQKNQTVMNYSNSFNDANMNRVQVSEVQQANDSAFFRRGGRWIDSRIANQGRDADVDEEIAIGSQEHLELARRLAKEGRQSSVSMQGEILVEVEGKKYLVR